MPLITATDITDLRLVVTDALTDTCTVQRPNASGTYANIATGVACMIQPNTRQSLVSEPGVALAGEHTFRIRFPLGQDVQPRDHIISGGVTFTIVGIHVPRTPQVLVDCDAERFA